MQSSCTTLMGFEEVTTSEESQLGFELRVGKLKNGGKDEVAGKMMKGRGDRVVRWNLRLCNMAFESSVLLEDWRSAVTIPLYNGKGERTECDNYRDIRLLILEKYMQGS